MRGSLLVDYKGDVRMKLKRRSSDGGGNRPSAQLAREIPARKCHSGRIVGKPYIGITSGFPVIRAESASNANEWVDFPQGQRAVVGESRVLRIEHNADKRSQLFVSQHNHWINTRPARRFIARRQCNRDDGSQEARCGVTRFLCLLIEQGDIGRKNVSSLVLASPPAAFRPASRP
jgi:hypothetical protein